MAYFALTLILSAPIWALSAASGTIILPGLPIAALSVVCPALAAIILTARHRGWTSVRAFLARAVDVRHIGLRWWFPALGISPAIAVATFVILRMRGSAIPEPQFAPGQGLALFCVFLAGAVAEELGWSGFALDRLQGRWGSLFAGVLLGGAWALWHYPALWQAHRSLAWIAWWTVGAIAMRLVMVWLYNGTGGSVFAVAAFHAMSNLCWQLFPIQGSWFDPRLHGLLMAVAALAVLLTSATSYRTWQARALRRLRV